jgi:hypothetical protein
MSETSPDSPRLRFLSFTEISAHRDCAAFGYLNYIARARPPTPVSMRLGTLVHAGFAAHCRADARRRGVNAPGEVSIEAAIKHACRERWGRDKDTTLEEDAETAHEVVARAAKGVDLRSGRFDHVVVDGYAAIERRFVIPIADPEVAAYYTGGFVAKIDLALYDREYDGRLALIDLKVSRSLDSDLGFDPQLALYQHAMGQCGYWPELAWQYRVSPAPVVPPERLAKRTKERALSTARDGFITEESFRKAAAEVGDNPDAPAYEKFLEWVRGRKPWACALGGSDRATAAEVFREAVISAREVVRRLSPEDAPRNFRSFRGGCLSRCSVYEQCATTRDTAELVSTVRLLKEAKPLPQISLEDL